MKGLIAVSESLGQRFQCSICLDIVYLPQTTSCGHTFCCECINSYISTYKATTCPLCCASLDMKTFHTPSIEFMGKLNVLAIKCPNGGCVWSGEYKTLLERHDKICQFGIYSCVCGTKIKMKERLSHLENCIKYMKCRLCYKFCLVDSKVTHDKLECSERICVCEDGCHQTFTDSQRIVHRQICTKRIRICPYQNVGCTYRGTQTALNIHCNQLTHDHLKLAMKTLQFQKNHLLDQALKLKPSNDWKYIHQTKSDNNTKKDLDVLSHKLDDLVDVWDDMNQEWKCGIIRELITPIRWKIDLIDNGNSLFFNLPTSHVQLFGKCTSSSLSSNNNTSLINNNNNNNAMTSNKRFDNYINHSNKNVTNTIFFL